MVYRRYKKRYGKRKRPSGRYTTMGAAKFLAKKAWRGVRMLKGMINVEKHYADVSATGVVSNTGSVVLLTQVAQGDDVSNRQGNSVLGKSLYIRMLLSRDAGNPNSANFVRCLIVKDLENTGSPPTVTDLLQFAAVNSPLNVDHTSRYQVIKDKIYGLSISGNAGSHTKFWIPVNDHMKYTGPGSTDVYKNAIYLILLTDQTVTRPNFDWYSRFGFYDN